MKIFVSSLNVPIGYTTPSFPSLYWPLGPNRPKYQQLYLYYSIDIWKFTLFWFVILWGAIYCIVGLMAALNLSLNHYRLNNFRNNEQPLPPKPRDSRHPIPYAHWKIVNNIFILLVYTLVGVCQGFIGGAVVGLILQSIYKAGSLSMSCWIPLCWAIALVLYDICSSYKVSSLIL